MADVTLMPHAYSEPRAHRLTQDTMIEDLPQISSRRAAPHNLDSIGITSPMSDDFPTPRALPGSASLVNPMTDPVDANNDFDDLYDISEESDTDALPIKLSASVKRRVGPKKSTYPSIVIPSPRQWPTIEKLRSATTTLSPTAAIALSPRALNQLQIRSQILPSTSSAPSLDGSLTSEELAVSSCPSTPALSHVDDEVTWEPPAQLDPSAFSLLQHINNQQDVATQEVVLEAAEVQSSEMREVVESLPIFGRFRLNTQDLPASPELEDELSALSVPSPGGFFASLDSSVRKTWSGAASAEPTTSVATEFYGVPWRVPRSSTFPVAKPGHVKQSNPLAGQRPTNPVEQSITVDEAAEDEPETARKGRFSPTDVIREVDEIDESYGATLQQNSAVNLDRTALWLCAQDNYMKAVCEEDDGELDGFRDIPGAVPSTPEQTSPVSNHSTPEKKSVRFVATDAPAIKPPRKSLIHDGTFWEGWRHNKRSARARDVFQQRQMRAEADHVRRTSCSKQHAEQLQGKFEINQAERPAPERPVSKFLPDAGEETAKALIGEVERERLALEQMQSSLWCMAAHKEVHGGSLLTSPIVQTFRGRHDVRVLDLDGQAHCGWAWTVAGDHPKAQVYTTVASDVEAHVAELSLEGPENHSVVAAPHLWDLPFPDNHFDVISARNLHSHLRTLWPKGKAADEYDLTLRECMRCLKPGGFLEFGLLDAELLHPTAASRALGVEFAFNLKTRGYDPSAGKSFLPRLKRAGFGDIKRAWMVLPVADVVPRWTDAARQHNANGNVESGSDAAAVSARTIGPDGAVEIHAPAVTGSTRDVRAVTGIIGARMWEQWIVKLNGEMGRSEARCLEGVAKALEESGRTDASWRCLVGWAQKD